MATLRKLMLEAPAGMPSGRLPSPLMLISDPCSHTGPSPSTGILRANFHKVVSACALAMNCPMEHHCQVCPTCSHRLTGHRCKLVCTAVRLLPELRGLLLRAARTLRGCGRRIAPSRKRRSYFASLAFRGSLQTHRLAATRPAWAVRWPANQEQSRIAPASRCRGNPSRR